MSSPSPINTTRNPRGLPGDLRRGGWLGRVLTRPVLAAGLFYGLITIVITWPASIVSQQVLLGHPGNDTWNHVWGFWWVALEIFKNGTWPSWTRRRGWS